jgi:hypothetical protein
MRGNQQQKNKCKKDSFLRFSTFLEQDFMNQTVCLSFTSACVSDAPSHMSTTEMLEIKSCSVEE